MATTVESRPSPGGDAPGGGAWSRRWTSLRVLPCAVLLVVQLAAILLYPFLTGTAIGGWGGGGRAVLGLIGVVTLALAVWAVRSTPALSWIALLLGGPVVVLTVVESFVPDSPPLLLVSSLLHAAFYFYTGYALVRYMFADSWVTQDEIWATGATFTVFAWAFAHLYVVVQLLWPGSFNAYADPEAPRTFFELLFLSVTTLSSTGLSDITPVLPHARSFVMIEQVAGMMYLAIVVARIVGLTIARFRR